MVVGSAPDESEDVIRGRRDEPRGRQTLIPGLDDLRGRPDQDIGIPDRGDAIVEGSRDPNGDPLGIENNRLDALGFGEREEGIGHQVLRVSRSQIPRQGSEDLELRLCLLRSGAWRHSHENERTGSLAFNRLVARSSAANQFTAKHIAPAAILNRLEPAELEIVKSLCV